MKRNRFTAIFLLMTLYSFCLCNVYGDEVINLQHIGDHNDHIEHFAPADMPDVYFDSDNLEIILVADGFSIYYNVEITPTTGYVPLISTQVDGYGDTIDISSLSDGYYTITITSEFNNQYEGTFQIE